MSLSTILLYTFIFLVVSGAIGILFTRNVFKASLFLLLCLISLAGIFVLQNAEFVAVAQIIVYAGGIIALIIFAIMLMEKSSGKPFVVGHGNLISGSLLGLALMYLLSNAILAEKSYYSTSETSSPGMEDIGVLLMTQFALPFEVVGILLMAALVGAAVMASPKNTNP